MANATGDKKLPQIYVYFPTGCHSRNSCFVYGAVEVTSQCRVDVYVTDVDLQKRCSNDSVSIVGVSNWQEHHTTQSPNLWLTFNQSSKYPDLSAVVYEAEDIPLHMVSLIMYDESILHSEILNLNLNLTSSVALQKLLTAKMRKPVSLTVSKQGSLKESLPMIGVSRVFHQLSVRYLNLKEIRKVRSQLEWFNMIFTLVVDFLLGLVLLQMVCSAGGTNYILETLSLSFKFMVNKLELLIKLLMGAPFGLKLNEQLAAVLARFFLYHLYLWKSYIDIISPVLYGIISLTTMLSGLGLTFQMALLSDMIGLVSLHAFCFYVYAARLYGLTLHGLRSTLRMFRGRKWNPLHHRVDVGHFSLDQLGVGMFIASSLLFFLPTILVFYIVFLSLRLSILAILEALKCLIWLLNRAPIYSLLLWLLNSPSIAGDVHFHVVGRGDSSRGGYPTLLKLTSKKLPFYSTLRLTSMLTGASANQPRLELWTLASKIVSGQLIYPM